MDRPPADQQNETPPTAQPARLEYQNRDIARRETLRRSGGVAKGIIACLAFVFCAFLTGAVFVVFIDEQPWEYDTRRTVELCVLLFLIAGATMLSLVTALQFLAGLPSLRDLIRRR